MSVYKCHSHFTGDFSAVKRGIPALAEKRILVNHVRLVRVKNNDVCDLSRLNISLVDSDDLRRIVTHLLRHLHDAGPEIAPGAEAAPESDPVTLGGTAVSPGAAFGHAQMFAEGELEIPHFTIEKTQTRAEFTRLRAAVHTVDKEFGELIAELNREEDAPTEAIAFLELHRQLLNDDSIISETQDIIRERLINAEWALSLKLEDIRRSFEEIDDDYLADRIDDIAQVIERVQRVLSGRRRPADTVSRMMSESSVILVAEDFSPADILILKRRQDISITGLIIEKGAATSSPRRKSFLGTPCIPIPVRCSPPFPYRILFTNAQKRSSPTRMKRRI